MEPHSLVEIETIIMQKKFVFIDCFTTWCSPCKNFNTLIEKQVFPIIKDREDIAFITLDIEDSAEITDWMAQFEIDIVPSVLVFKEGKQLPITYKDCRTNELKENAPFIRGNALNIAEIVKKIIT